MARITDLGHVLGASVHTDVVVADHDEEAIVERESNVDLIVMASSQSPVSQRAFLGHLVDYVVRHASCPVVVVGMP